MLRCGGDRGVRFTSLCPAGVGEEAGAKADSVFGRSIESEGGLAGGVVGGVLWGTADGVEVSSLDGALVSGTAGTGGLGIGGLGFRGSADVGGLGSREPGRGAGGLGSSATEGVVGIGSGGSGGDGEAWSYGTIGLRGIDADRLGSATTGSVRVSGAALDGSRAPAEVTEVVLRHIGLIRACYQRGLPKAEGDFSGRIEVAFVIEETGAPSGIRIASSTLAGGESVGDCIVRQFRRMKFPPPRNGRSGAYTFPFVFRDS